MSESVWMATAPEKKFPSLEGDIEADVAIIGGGISGVVAALLLTREGKKVVLLEARRIGHGETGHTTAHLTEQVDAGYRAIAREFDRTAARLVARAGRRAIDAIGSIAERERIDCSFEVLPAFIYTDDPAEREALEEEARAAADAGIAASFTTEAPLPFPIAGAIRFDRQAQVHPLRFLHAVAALAAREGARMFEQTRALDAKDGTPALVRTDRGVVRAREILVLANVPLDERGLLQTKLPAARTYAVAGKTKTPLERALFWDTADPYHYVRGWSDAGESWIIAGGEDHRTGADSATAAHFDALEAWGRARFGLEDVAHRWSGQIIEPPDGLPYIGRDPGAGHVWVATGYSGQGITLGTFSALMLTDLVMGRPCEWEELFAPKRLPALEAVPTWIKDNLEFPKRLALDRLTDRDVGARTLAAVRPGEGCIVELDGRKIAASRDGDGALHLVSAICTHFGCDVRWNSAETTWDCPCHGSRFARDGSVVNGPAVKGLERVTPKAE